MRMSTDPGNRGDAYLSALEERRLLFTQGVHLHVRPDEHRWRPLSSLSGGQQALAGLALAFALQAALPQPFCFFDEVCANFMRACNYMLQAPCKSTPMNLKE